MTLGNLTSGHTTSCGCLHKEATSRAKKKHGMTKSRLYNIWSMMRRRCNDTKSISFPKYGERGITVCDEWQGSFEEFRDWAIGNGYADGLTIDRIDNDKGYSPDNCRWTTPKLQANNTRQNRVLNLNGVSHTLQEWSDITGINRKTISDRIDRHGWTVEQALTRGVSR